MRLITSDMVMSKLAASPDFSRAVALGNRREMNPISNSKPLAGLEDWGKGMGAKLDAAMAASRFGGRGNADIPQKKKAPVGKIVDEQLLGYEIVPQKKKAPVGKIVDEQLLGYEIVPQKKKAPVGKIVDEQLLGYEIVPQKPEYRMSPGLARAVALGNRRQMNPFLVDNPVAGIGNQINAAMVKSRLGKKDKGTNPTFLSLR